MASITAAFHRSTKPQVMGTSSAAARSTIERASARSSAIGFSTSTGRRNSSAGDPVEVRVGGGGDDDGIERSGLEVGDVAAVEAIGGRPAGGLVDIDDRREVGSGMLADDAGVQRTHGAGAHERDAQGCTFAAAPRDARPHRCWLVPRHWSSVTAPRVAEDKVPLLCRHRVQPRRAKPEPRRADRPGIRP